MSLLVRKEVGRHRFCVHYSTRWSSILEKLNGKSIFLNFHQKIIIFDDVSCTSAIQKILTYLSNRHLKFGYVPQSPWLLNDTIKENIIFGFPYQEKHFARVIQLCGLNADINSLPSKHHTVIGGRGVALSGGQKQRLMIARMLYSKPDIVLLVNPNVPITAFCHR